MHLRLLLLMETKIIAIVGVRVVVVVPHRDAARLEVLRERDGPLPVPLLLPDVVAKEVEGKEVRPVEAIRRILARGLFVAQV